MKTTRMLSSVGGILLLALLAPVVAAGRPPQSGVAATQVHSWLVRPPSFVGAHLVLSQVSAAPARARAGRTYVLRGTIVNEGSAGARGPVVVHLLRVGSRPLAIGRTSVGLDAHGSQSFVVRVRLPRALHDGSYALVACVRRAGRSGALGCATAARHLMIGSSPGVGPGSTRSIAASTACTSGAHSLSPFGA